MSNAGNSRTPPNRSMPRSPSCGPRWPPWGVRRPLATVPGPISTAPRSCCRRLPSAIRITTSLSSNCGSLKPPSSRRRRRSPRHRVSLGLPPQPEKGKSLSDVPPDLNQTFSAVRSALAACMTTMTLLGEPLPFTDLTPNQALEEFRQLGKKGNVDQILHDLVPRMPAVLQAKAGLEQAQHDIEQAELNLRYCDIRSEIDGVVTGKNVNPGNAVQAGQALMAVRSLKDIWIDTNFKETQLADLRIGQRVRCEVDMYGSHREFEGRITGFTMGTGQTLSLLPAQNATGNFVKIVQRLPVRVELTNYDSDKTPLFVGLSVTPYVYYKEPPMGPHAGDVLQPLAALPSETR